MGKITDHINLLSKLTPARSWNGIRVWSSYHWSRMRAKPIHRGMPVSLSLEPTTSCNLRCPECPSGLRSFSRPTGMLDPNLLESTLDQLDPTLLYLLLYFQGEPYLHPQFTDLVKMASKRRIYTATSTNAHFLDSENARKTVESGLDRLIVSIDGTTQETYESYRIGGRLDKVIQGTKEIIHWKKALKSRTPHVIFQFLVVKPNEHQIGSVKKMARELGVNEVRFKTAQIYDYKNGSPLIPEQEQYSRYQKNDVGHYEIKNKLLNQCWKMWHSCVMTWDGAIVPCCFDKDATHKMGSLSNNSFEEIWKGDAYQNFRGALLRSRSEIDICKNCTEGTKVWA